MKTILIIILLIIDIVCWIFSTTLVVNGKHTQLAFKFKSIFYWLAIILTFSIGFYISQ